jgi:hypothetical protein
MKYFIFALVGALVSLRAAADSNNAPVITGNASTKERECNQHDLSSFQVPLERTNQVLRDTDDSLVKYFGPNICSTNYDFQSPKDTLSVIKLKYGTEANLGYTLEITFIKNLREPIRLVKFVVTPT